jgi:hypothetical protein
VSRINRALAFETVRKIPGTSASDLYHRCMRCVFVLAVIAIAAPAAAAPGTPAAWAERLATHYAHAKSVKVKPSDRSIANALCDRPRVFALEPGFAELTVTSRDENLFQSSTIRIARIEGGTDAIAAVRKAGDKCMADKRYQVALQAGDTLFLYSARCNQMRTPFPYDVADLVAAIEGEGGKLGRLAIVNACGSFDHHFATLAAIRKNARKPRKLYQHRFPASREAFKQRPAAPAGTPAAAQ